jgi:hypothetical protein
VKIDLPQPSCIVFAHLEVVHFVFFGVDVFVACCFFEISHGVHFVRDRIFIVLISLCSEGEVSIGCVDGCKAVMLRKPFFVLKLGTNGSFEKGLDSGYVCG